TVLDFKAADATGIERRTGKEELEAAKGKDGWRIRKPADLPADTPTLDGLLAELAHLRAKKVAAYPAKDLKPFGLDEPTAPIVVPPQSAEGKGAEHTLRIGQPADKAAGEERFAVVDKSDAVLVLPAELSRLLVAPVLHFRDRTVARVPAADQATQE